MQLLVAEDERSAGAYLVKGLREAGFIVDWVQSGEAALHHAREAAYDLIILDIGLPGLTGLDVVAALRPAVTTPVIFLTARDRVEDRVHGLEQGADDYLVKPYAFSELLARVRALLRRGKTLESDLLVAADLDMHLLRRRVVRGGQVLTLTAREYQLLELLMRRQGEILPRTLIAELVWGINFDTDTNVIEVAIRRLRAKVDDPFADKLIHTVRGFGYVLEPRA